MKNKLVQLLIALIVLVGVGWYMMRSIDLDVVANIITSVSLAPVLFAVLMVIAGHVVRAIRWRRLLTHTKQTIGLYDAFSAVMIGYAANTIITRSGELLRPLSLSRRTTLSFPTLLSSVVLERVLDIISLLIAMSTLIIFRYDVIQRALPDFSPLSIVISLGIPLAVLALLIWTIAFTRFGMIIAERFIKPISAKAASAVEHIIHQVTIGTATLRSSKGWLSIIFETVLIWLFYALPIWFVLNAMPWDNNLVFSFSDAWILLVIIAIGVTIAPTPGALGVYQAFAQVALVRLFGATPDQGLAFGILSWVLNYGTALVIGGLCFIIDRATAVPKDSVEA